MSTYDKLDTINDSLNNIKTAIIAKGQTPSGDITTYAAAIENIDSGSSTRFGLSLNNFVGTVTNGTLGAVSSINGITFTGVEDIANNALNGKFNTASGAISFPDLTTVTGSDACYNAFMGSSISSVDLSALTTINGSSAFKFAFMNSHLSSIDLSALTTTANHCFSNAFRDSRLTNIDLSALTTISNEYVFSYAFDGCNYLTSIGFPNLTTVSGDWTFEHAFGSYSLTSIGFPNLTTVSGDYAFYGAFNCDSLTSISFPNLITVSGNDAFGGAFESCYSLTSIDLSNVTTVGTDGFNHICYGCSLTGNLNLSSLTTVGENGLYEAFHSNNRITSVNVSSLTTVGDEGLYGAFARNPITSITFPALTHIGRQGLYGVLGECYDENNDTTLTDVYFPALTSNSFEAGDESAFDSLVGNDDGVTVHFPSNLQAVIGNWQSVTDGFGGINTTVLFDLPSTENVNQGGGSATDAAPDSTDPTPIIPDPDDDEIDWGQ